jgi:hypothetical protein
MSCHRDFKWQLVWPLICADRPDRADPDIINHLMNKFFRNHWRYGCIVVLIWLVSCTPKQGVTQDELMKWNLDTLAGNYDSIGRRNPKWDKDAEEALTRFARIRSGPNNDPETQFDLIGFSARSAVEAGCDDPMIRFLYLRYAPRNTTLALAEQQKEYRSLAKDMESSAYLPVRKFYVNLYAAGILWQRRNTNLWPEVRQLRATALNHLTQVVQDKTVPDAEAGDACQELFQMMERNTYELTNAYNTIVGPLFRARPKQAASYLVKANFYLIYAWRGRGNGTADKVTEEGWDLFRTRLAESEKALKRAWALDPKNPQIPALMINVSEGQQKKRPEMELWFDRAMRLDPNNYEACRNKLHYLLPQWYGSRDEMVTFGRECAASTNWGGRVPLTLVDAHSNFAGYLKDEDDRAAYWLLPDVWPDVRTAYEKYAQMNPSATRFRYPFAAYAFRCGQWQAFTEQIELIRKTGDELNYRYFGGKDVFDKMAEHAAQQTGKKPDS